MTDETRPAPRLAEATLASLPGDVERPRYDRHAVTPGIAHIGVGAFCRAHTCLYTDDLLASGARDWGIVGIAPNRAAVRDALAPQDWLYTLSVRAPEGDRRRVIGALRGVVSAADEAAATLRLLTDPSIRVVTLTVTEKGYCQDAATGDLDETHPAIRADLAGAAAPRSVPGLLAEAIGRRRRAGVAPFTVLSCDNLAENGLKAHRIVSRFATLRDQDLGRFIENEVRFPCSMVDRITPATRDEDRARLRADCGYDDAWPVVAEPFHQWVIEDSFSAGRPRWEDAGAQLVADVHPFETMKLRCLNGTHSALAYIGSLLGLETVSAAIADADLGAFIRRLWQEDLVPTVPPVPGTDLARYTADLEERYRNPAIRHLTLQIAMDGSQKLPPRLLAPALERIAKGGQARAVAFVTAAWMRFLSGRTDAGAAYTVSDPLAGRLLSPAAAAGTDAASLVGSLFAIADIFPPAIAADAGFRALVTEQLATIFTHGTREALRRFLRG